MSDAYLPSVSKSRTHRAVPERRDSSSVLRAGATVLRVVSTWDDGAVPSHGQLHAERRREYRAIAIGSAALWVFAAGIYGLWLKLLEAMSGPTSCPVPGMDSTYGESSWGWLPPGTSCSYEGYPGVADTHPSWFVPAALVAWLVGTLVLWGLIEWRSVRRQARLTDAGALS